jgi:hypothetical protein
MNAAESKRETTDRKTDLLIEEKETGMAYWTDYYTP